MNKVILSGRMTRDAKSVIAQEIILSQLHDLLLLWKNVSNGTVSQMRISSTVSLLVIVPNLLKDLAQKEKSLNFVAIFRPVATQIKMAKRFIPPT